MENPEIYSAIIVGLLKFGYKVCECHFSPKYIGFVKLSSLPYVTMLGCFALFFIRDCASDPTCVLCIECFQKSAHRKHRYRVRWHLCNPKVLVKLRLKKINCLSWWNTSHM